MFEWPSKTLLLLLLLPYCMYMGVLSVYVLCTICLPVETRISHPLVPKFQTLVSAGNQIRGSGSAANVLNPRAISPVLAKLFDSGDFVDFFFIFVSLVV